MMVLGLYLLTRSYLVILWYRMEDTRTAELSSWIDVYCVIFFR